MSTKEVLDTHRLMYRNARIRALDLSDATTPLQFVNITDDSGNDAEIGNIVYTDALGYVFYGANHRRVSCLGVKKSAIIQVDLNGNDNWNDIEWIVRKDDDSQYVKVSDVGKVLDSNNNVIWDPLNGNWSFPNYVTEDQIGNGMWAEGEMTVTATTPKKLNIDEWTHTITIQPGHANEYEIEFAVGRIGQCVTIVNNSEESVTITELHDGGSSSETITAHGAILAVRSLTAEKWIIRSFDAGEHIVGTSNVLKQLLSASVVTDWISAATIKMNANNNKITPSADGIHDLPPKTVLMTYGNDPMHVLINDGFVQPIAGTGIIYDGNGVWYMLQVSSQIVNPAHIAGVVIDGNRFPGDHPFGSYNGTNDLYIRLRMTPGERIRVIVKVPENIVYGTGHQTNIYINECKVYADFIYTLPQADNLVSGWLECATDGNGAYYFWNKDDYAVKV